MAADGARPSDPAHRRARLAAALGTARPITLDPRPPPFRCPAGSRVTVEPGGQVELASPPLPDLAGLLRTTARRRRRAAPPARRRGPAAQPRAADPDRPPRRLLDAPALPRDGAGLRPDRPVRPQRHVLDRRRAGVRRRRARGPTSPRRWAAVHALGPVLLAAFANSPAPARPAHRLEVLAVGVLDAVRSRPHRAARPRPASPAGPGGGLGPARAGRPGAVRARRAAAGWCPSGLTFAEWVGGASPAPPTIADLDYHVSTLFPPVRPHGHLEVRYVDMQPGGGGRCPPPCSRRCCPTRASSTSCATPASRPQADGFRRPPRAGRPRARPAAVQVFELALRPPTRSRRPGVGHRRARRHDRAARAARPAAPPTSRKEPPL